MTEQIHMTKLFEILDNALPEWCKPIFVIWILRQNLQFDGRYDASELYTKFCKDNNLTPYEKLSGNPQEVNKGRIQQRELTLAIKRFVRTKGWVMYNQMERGKVYTKFKKGTPVVEPFISELTKSLLDTLYLKLPERFKREDIDNIYKDITGKEIRRTCTKLIASKLKELYNVVETRGVGICYSKPDNTKIMESKITENWDEEEPPISKFSKEEKLKFAEILRGNKPEQPKSNFSMDIVKLGKLSFEDSTIQIGNFEISGNFTLKVNSNEKETKA